MAYLLVMFPIREALPSGYIKLGPHW